MLSRRKFMEEGGGKRLAEKRTAAVRLMESTHTDIYHILRDTCHRAATLQFLG